MTDRAARAYDLASLALLLVAGVLVLLTFQDYGITWDEPIQAHYGELVRRYFASGFADKSALGWSDLWLYGGGFDFPVTLLQRISPLEAYDTRHLLTAMVGLLGVVGVWKLGRVLGGPRAAFLAALLLLLTPRWWGHAFNNPKDIPFAAGYVWAIYYLVRMLPELPRVRTSLALRFGIAAGLTLSVRVGGLLLLAYLGLAMVVFLGFRVRRERRTAWREVPALARSYLLAAVPAWILMIWAWPWAQHGPLHRPIQALLRVSHFGWQGEVLHDGASIKASELPISYGVHWLGITVPIVVLALLGMGLVFAAVVLIGREVRPTHPTVTRHAMAAFGALFPLAYVAAVHSVLYDGIRHLLFVIPVLVALAASVASQLWIQITAWRDRTARPLPRVAPAVLAAAFGLWIGSHGAVMAHLHPFETTYFNELVGGLPGAYGRYETDYWGNGYRPAVERLVRRLEAEAAARGGEPPVYRVKVCSNHTSSENYFPPWLRLERDTRRADFFIATTRWKCDRTVNGPVIDTIERMGTPLVLVKDRRALTRRGTQLAGPP